MPIQLEVVVVNGCNKKKQFARSCPAFFSAHRRGAIRMPVLILGLLVLSGLAIWFFRPVSKVQKVEQVENSATQQQQTATEVQPLTTHSAEGVCPKSDNPDDPTQDGWQSEAFASTAKHQLEEILRLLELPANEIEAKCKNLLAGHFEGEGVIPPHLQTVFEDERFLIQRQEQNEKGDPEISSDRVQQGVSAFVQSLKEAVPLFSQVKDLRIEVKVVGVELGAERATTKQKIALNGRTGSGRIEQHATWTAGWLLASDQHPPRLASLEVSHFEQTQVRDQGTPLLADCTKSVFGSEEFIPAQVFTGYPEHLDRIQDWRYCVLLGTPGLAVADVNGDGLEDLYVCQETAIPNLLLIQQPDGTVKNEAASWGVDWLHNSPSASFADLDNDGDQDIAVVVTGGIIISSNEGNRFEKRVFLPTADDTRSISVADFDSDGKLDLFVCVYGPDGTITDRESAIAGISYRGSLYHDATEGGPNALFHNRGDWQFVDTTTEMGLGEANHRLTLAASWEDYDNDGDLDLYVANDYAPNSLFRNDVVDSASATNPSKRRFTDIAPEVGASDQANGMSVSWGDHNRDGWMDLYVGNMFSSAGNRVTTQKNFKEGADEDVRTALKRFARGNTLLENQGDGTFKDTSEAAGVTMGRWAWSSPFVDLNNDGWEDMLVANGFITGEDKRDL
jgi:hypothetical protein